MGNQPSSSSQRSSASQGAGESNINSTSSSSRSRSRSHSHGHGHGHSQSLSSNATLQPPRDPNPRGGRRESIHALSSVKATAAPPSASLESAAAPAAHNNNSTLTVASVASTLRAAHDNSRPNSIAVTSSTANPPPDTTSITSRMGAEQSRQRHHRDRPSGEQQQQQQSGQSIIHKARSAPSPQSQPVDVPAHHNLNQHLHHHPQAIPPTNMQSPATTMSADAADNATPDYFAPPPQQFARPPRLPLPIEEELHTPGSPIISPADLAPVDIAEGAEGSSLASRASVLSSITTEDDDAVDEFPRPHTGPTVPTLIEWEGGGEKVYVTGTFVEWNRKFRLHRK